MKVLISEGVGNPEGKTYDLSWGEFVELAHTYNRAVDNESDGAKRGGKWFSCAHYRKNHRLRENIIGSSIACVVIDLDGITDTRAVEATLAHYEYVAWTTWNSLPSKPRWRIVLPLEHGLDFVAFERVTNRLMVELSKYAKVDPRSSLGEQLWFFPEHKRSSHKGHRVWQHEGQRVRCPRVLSVDFTNAKLVRKAEEVGEGERNNSLVIRLGEKDALRCESREELIALAVEWNDRLSSPMPRKEVAAVARKKWNWMQRGEGLARRANAWGDSKAQIDADDLPEVGVGLLDHSIQRAAPLDFLIADFLQPGATMLTAKMKEGKSFLSMQLALALATMTPFMGGKEHPGFAVNKRSRVVILAGEDTAEGMGSRFAGSIATGHLPELARSDDVLVVFNDQLDRVRESAPSKVSGLALFESLVERWYKQGYRVILLDPLKVLEGALHIFAYPGTQQGMNAHTRDFQTLRYYTKVAQQYNDLRIVVSLHHGKTKREQNQGDPGDLIAGTSGSGAGAVATMSLLPTLESLQAEEDPKEGYAPKRREFYVHGRDTREKRVLVEQDIRTGLWRVIGVISDLVTTESRKNLFEALMHSGATDNYVSAEVIAKKAGMKSGGVHKVLNKARRESATYLGWKLLVKKGPTGGYRLVESSRVN